MTWLQGKAATLCTRPPHQVERHGDAEVQVLPVGQVVAGPRGGVAVAADVVGAREHEGPLVGARALQALERGARHEHAVHVVVVRVRLPPAQRGVAAVHVAVGHRLVDHL